MTLKRRTLVCRRARGVKVHPGGIHLASPTCRGSELPSLNFLHFASWSQSGHRSSKHPVPYGAPLTRHALGKDEPDRWGPGFFCLEVYG